MKELWVDKHRPKTLADYVWKDDSTKSMILRWVAEKATDNLVLAGPPGVGKTSLASVLIRELGVEPSDRLWINASLNTSIDDVRVLIRGFIETGGWSGLKYVVLDEADRMSKNAQDALKSDMEEFSNTVRWILTTNSINRIADPVRDRCTVIEIQKPDRDAFEERIITILGKEGINVDDEETFKAVEAIVRKTYPSLRRCIRDMQAHAVDGRIVLQSGSSRTEGNWQLNALALFKVGKIREARKLICGSISRDEVEEVFTWLYQNSDLFGDNEDSAIVIVADAAWKHSFAADPEINLAGCMARLGEIIPRGAK